MSRFMDDQRHNARGSGENVLDGSSKHLGAESIAIDDDSVSALLDAHEIVKLVGKEGESNEGHAVVGRLLHTIETYGQLQ